MRLGDFIKPGTSRQVEAQTQINDGADEAWIFDLFLRVPILRPLECALGVVFPKVDAVAKPLVSTLGMIEVRYLPGNNSLDYRFFRAMKAKHKSRVALIARPIVSHGSTSWSCHL